jgi:hypothetical protein
MRAQTQWLHAFTCPLTCVDLVSLESVYRHSAPDASPLERNRVSRRLSDSSHLANQRAPRRQCRHSASNEWQDPAPDTTKFI